MSLDSFRISLDSQVYMLSAATRCNVLASEMHQLMPLGAGFTPPSLSPQPPPSAGVSPPPPRPPRPNLPDSEGWRVRYQSPGHVTLSTYFLGSGEDGSGNPSDGGGNNMALTNVANSLRDLVLDQISTRGLDRAQWARCSYDLHNAPLPCRTGDIPDRCISGARHCGTTEENTQEPWMELDLRGGIPTDQDYYFFGMEFTLPDDSELGALFFQSSQGISLDRGDTTNRYYEIAVLDEYHNPLAQQCKPFFKQSVDVYSDGLVHFRYVCLEPLAEDADYEAMRHVRYVRLTLSGAYRMIWINSVRVIWRAINDLPPANPPPPSPTPDTTLAPSAPPDAPGPAFTGGCLTYPLLSFGDAFVGDAYTEPCGLSFDACCALSYEHNLTSVFTITAAGCCTLYTVALEADRVNLAIGAYVPNRAKGFGSASTGVRLVPTNHAH